MPKLDQIQDEAVEFGLREKTWLLFFEMGLGKTFTAIKWIIKSKFKRVIILGRFDDLNTWEEELQLHAPQLEYFNVCARKKSGWRAMALSIAFYSEYPIILMTYDAVKQLKPLLLELIGGIDAVVADEVTEIKHPTTQRTKDVLECFVPRVMHRLGMSGTPMTNSPMDIFTQMKFADGGKRLGENFYSFRPKFFWPEPIGHRWHIFSDKLKLLNKLIYQKAVRAKKEDVLDLPPKVFYKKDCLLTDQQLHHYERVRDEFELELKGGEILELQYVVQQFTKLLQITDGFYYTEDGPVDLPSGKMEKLKWLMDLPEIRRKKKIVIWGVFNHELGLIRDAMVELGYHGVMFWKHTPDRKAARVQFRDDPKCQLFIGQAASGIGMNELKVSDTVIYYSRSLKLIHRLQSVDRTHRKGSEIHDSITYIDMIVPRTVDSKVYKMLQSHKDVADSIIDMKVALGMLN